MPFVLNTKSSNYQSLIKCLERALLYQDNTKKDSHVIIPGVSSFDTLISSINESEKEKLLSYKYILGICAGAQILFESSEEGKENGLGFLKGKIKKISTEGGVKVPHLGWNTLSLNHRHPMAHLFEGVDLARKKFYFSHSYRFPDSDDVVAYVEYGERFPAVVAKDNIFAIQFHPEKSYEQGIQILKNFCRI